jgi:membrane-anchored protein YejM (alkaline phosphatase superfamily)
MCPGDIMTSRGAMRNNLPAVVSGLVTFILLAIIDFVMFVAQMVALTGVIDQSKASTAMGMGVACQGIILLFASAFAGWFANTLIMRFDWTRALAVIASVIVATLLGAAISLISVVVSIPVAGIR